MALARGRTFDVVTQVSVGHAWLNLRDSLESAATAWYLAELADRSLEERHAAEPLYALLRRAYELLDAGMAPGRVARWYEMHLLDELGVRPEVDRCVECDRVARVGRAVPLGAAARRRPVRALSRPAARADGTQPRRRSSCSRRTSASTSRRSRRCGWGRWSSARSRPPCASSSATPSSATPGRWRSSTRSARSRWPVMATVELRDIVTDADREAVLGLQRGPGQERFVAASMASHSQDAIEDAGVSRGCGPRTTGDRAGGLRDDQRRDPRAETLAADDGAHRPVLPVAPAHRCARSSGSGYGDAAIDAVVAYLRTRPGRGDRSGRAAAADEGSPQPFYERYGFVPTDRRSRVGRDRSCASISARSAR